MTARRLTPAALERLLGRLSDRDKAIAADLARVRVLTGAQLERLHFTDLSPTIRGRIRRRVLGRLVDVGIAATLTRRIGGARAGSSGLVYALGLAGQRLMPLLQPDDAAATPGRARQPWTPGRMFLAHTLTVSELYARMVEQQRSGLLKLGTFLVEPACWHPNGMGGFIKPDAYLVASNQDHTDDWWIEVDRATESLPTLRRKLLAYVDFANTGQLGPGGVTPRILITVPHPQRLEDIRSLLRHLPPSTPRLITVVLETQAAKEVNNVLTTE